MPLISVHTNRGPMPSNIQYPAKPHSYQSASEKYGKVHAIQYCGMYTRHMTYTDRETAGVLFCWNWAHKPCADKMGARWHACLTDQGPWEYVAAHPRYDRLGLRRLFERLCPAAFTVIRHNGAILLFMRGLPPNAPAIVARYGWNGRAIEDRSARRLMRWALRVEREPMESSRKIRHSVNIHGCRRWAPPEERWRGEDPDGDGPGSGSGMVPLQLRTGDDQSKPADANPQPVRAVGGDTTVVSRRPRYIDNFPDPLPLWVSQRVRELEDVGFHPRVVWHGPHQVTIWYESWLWFRPPRPVAA